MSDLTITLTIDEHMLTTILTKLNNSISIEAYILNLIDNDLNSRISLNYDFYYDREKEKIYYNNIEVSLTKIEYELFKLLFNNCNTLITLEEILTEVWKGKEVTRFSLRNYIKQLRTTLHPYLIKNFHNNGYMMVIN